jgi:hypothetical protein
MVLFIYNGTGYRSWKWSLGIAAHSTLLPLRVRQIEILSIFDLLKYLINYS